MKPEFSAPDLAGARVVVVGLGRSGVAAARACLRHGARVTATDSARLEALSAEARALAEGGGTLAAGGHDAVDLASADLVVISPGVPAFPALAAAEARGVLVIGEIELASRLLPGVPTIAITGSNGKSTTTTLVGELCAALGLETFVGGNLGTPPAEIVVDPASPSFDVLVLEISSFQAERIPTYRPTSAALLNVSDNHLDRYDGFDAYVRAKGNLFVHQTESDVAVVPAGDARCLAEAARGRGRVVTFGPASSGAAFAFDRDVVVDRARGISYARAEMRVAGDHNAANVAAALALVSHLEPDPAIVRRVLASFAGLPHRIVKVATRAGVTYYDDSKGTNVGAVVAAIRGLSEEKIVLIAGGRDKLGSYDPLVAALRDRGRAAVLIGEAADRIAEAIGDAVPVAR
ncbi:MAG TPA: UDP-N-acetylmuramoyl-L-alanine--D-glutamate ligase, partial [Polyangiaceae bacterium]|nr:UDP-N-acetylmuramoyl-L-alanine--D-glutamate ligase [Polyangiaceae bacterium]